MPFIPQKSFEQKFTADNDTQAELESWFDELPSSEDPSTGDDLITEINGALTSIYFVHSDICKKLPIYWKMRAFLEVFYFQVPITEEPANLVALED